MRELVVLGTASQVPTRTRNHNGYLVLWDGDGLLFDPGEGTQRQLTLAGVAVSRIIRICLTHVHGDHCLGLPGVLAWMTLDAVEHPVHLHYPASGDISAPRPGHSFAIVMDTAPSPGAEELASGVDLLLAESTYADEEAGLAEAYLH